MSDQNIWEAVFQSFGKVSSCIQTHLHSVLNHTNLTSSPTTQKKPLFSMSSTSSSSKVHQNPDVDPTNHVQVKSILNKGEIGGPVTKEELGRATWTFLHTLAAQYPEKPTRQQKRDVKELMSILSRLYPCKECADHFKEVLRGNPVEAGSQFEFSRWLCRVHNVVNRSLGKPVFPCERVDARWGKLECEQRACDLLGDTPNFGRD